MCCVKPLHYQQLATTIDHELAYFGNLIYGTTTQCYRIGISFLDNMKLNIFKSKPSTSVQLRLMQTYEGRQFATVEAGMLSRSRGLGLGLFHVVGRDVLCGMRAMWRTIVGRRPIQTNLP